MLSFAFVVVQNLCLCQWGHNEAMMTMAWHFKKNHRWPRKKRSRVTEPDSYYMMQAPLVKYQTITANMIQIYLEFLSVCSDSSKSRRVWLRRHKKCVLDSLVGCIVFRFPCCCAALIKYSSKNNIQNDTFEWPLWYHCAELQLQQLWPLFLKQND